MKYINKPLAAFFAAAIVLGSLHAASKETPENAKLRKMTDPYEVLAETIPAGDVTDALSVEKAFEKADRLKEGTKALLTKEIAGRFDLLDKALQEARASKDSVGVALAAAEIYKLIINSLNTTTLVDPKEVDLLDYVGFRGITLLKSSSLDWEKLAQNANEGNIYWKRIRAKLTHEKLQAAMDKALHELGDAAKAHEPAAYMTQSKAVLDLVDELENFFNGEPVSM